MQRARDGRRGEREHVHVGAKLLELLLVRDAEALLLIDDDEAQVLELGLLRQDRMRADDDVDIALGQPFARVLHLLGGNEARKAADLQREAGESLGKILVVLAGEQGGGRDHRDLLSVHRRDESGAQRDLGLAETDIAADQPVHRLAAFQIAQHIGNRAFLVVGLLVLEAVEELVVDAFLDFEHRRLLERALGRDLHQLAGDLADALLEAGAALLPCFAAEPVEHDRLFGRAVAA